MCLVQTKLRPQYRLNKVHLLMQRFENSTEGVGPKKQKGWKTHGWADWDQEAGEPTDCQRLADQTRVKYRCGWAEGNQVEQWQVSRGSRCHWSAGRPLPGRLPDRGWVSGGEGGAPVVAWKVEPITWNYSIRWQKKKFQFKNGSSTLRLYSIKHECRFREWNIQC